LKPYIEEKRAIVLPFGLGDEVKEEPIVLDRLNAGSSTFQDSNRKILPHQTETLKLKIETLDHLYEQGLISKVSFIKADIEGYERKLLKGASKLIKTFRPKLALCYYHLPDDFEVLRNIIESFQLGYRFTLNNEVLFAWTKL
ncbi:FkbM family methyltransferase, partial [Pseudothermotoga sp.]|nr:FkbM family methyltransferase [Pseudothermotoga sp.]MDW8140643.1 FkbM family methyltransferase [Pseudothermotoga sp.]